MLAPLIANYRGSELALVIMSLALGATLGKLVVYLVGRGVSSINKVQRVFRGMKSLTVTYSRSTFMSRVTFLIVFLAAALPIPDDVVYIPVGLSKYSLPLFFIAVL
ncbi:MAG: VTT domain-containing protein, partial [Desulfurococcaceae archaeon]